MTVSKNAFLNMEEMTINASYIMGYLLQKGWSKEAIAGMLGNMQTESTINPGIWQNLAEGNTRLGFGLVQWTPASKYINWAKARNLPYREMDSNLERILYEVKNNIQWIHPSMTFKQFTKLTSSPEECAELFIKHYERPAEPNQPIRAIQARYWYDNLDGEGVCVQLAQFPMDYLYVTQGEGGGFSHAGTLAIDFVGKSHHYPYYAPCYCECIGRNDSEAILTYKSIGQVMCADGKMREIVWRNIHDDDLMYNVGDKLLKGQIMGHTGNSGNSSGEHWHLDVWEGTEFTRTNPLHIYDVFAVNNVEIANGFGYKWKTSNYEDCDNDGGDGGDDKNNKNDLIHLLLSDALNGWR
jgi:Membrane proteins related to metalloendopeptidases